MAASVDRYGNPIAGSSSSSGATQQGWSTVLPTAAQSVTGHSQFAGLDESGRKTLEALIASLTAGTDGSKEAATGKTDAMTALGDILKNYSSGAAGADTALAMQTLVQQGMKEALPNIQRSIENAGTSGGGMQALLAQNAATEAAGKSAIAGLQAKTEYGKIASGAATNLGQLAGQEDPALAQLLEALKLTGIQSSNPVNTVGTGTSLDGKPIDTRNKRVVTDSRGNQTISYF